MGDYAILIRGTGPHHNEANPGDADRLAAQLVEGLKAAGHTVHDHHFLDGGETRFVVLGIAEPEPHQFQITIDPVPRLEPERVQGMFQGKEPLNEGMLAQLEACKAITALYSCAAQARSEEAAEDPPEEPR